MNPSEVYAMRMSGIEAIENGSYPEGINLLALVTELEAKNRDANYPVILPQDRIIEPRWTNHIPRVTEEELQEEREQLRASYRKPITDKTGGQLQLFT